MEALELFPTPLFRIDNALNSMQCYEIEHICKSIDYFKTSNPHDFVMGSQRSQNTCFLQQYFPDLQITIENTFIDIAKMELGLEETCEFRISSSWATRTKPGGFSTKHTHVNAFWSGVLYLSNDSSPIAFIKDTERGVMLAADKHTRYSVNKIEHKPEMGQIIFFPSTLRHQVCINTSEKNRYSVAFNLLPHGVFGKHDSTAHINVLGH